MKTDIKSIQDNLIKKVLARNKLIINDAIFKQLTFRELASKYRVSLQRINQILMKNGIKVPVIKGSRKYKIFCERVSAGKIKQFREDKKLKVAKIKKIK